MYTARDGLASVAAEPSRSRGADTIAPPMIPVESTACSSSQRYFAVMFPPTLIPISIILDLGNRC